MLDRLGLSMPSTHSGARGAGLELEKQLEGFQTMGIKYTTISGGGRGAPPGRGQRRGSRAWTGRGPLAPGAYYNAGTGITHNSFTEAEAFGPYQPPVTLESVKQALRPSMRTAASRRSLASRCSFTTIPASSKNCR